MIKFTNAVGSIHSAFVDCTKATEAQWIFHLFHPEVKFTCKVSKNLGQGFGSQTQSFSPLRAHNPMLSNRSSALEKVAQWKRSWKPLPDSQGRPSGFTLLPTSGSPRGAPCGLGSTQNFQALHLASVSDLKQKLKLVCLGREKVSLHICANLNLSQKYFKPSLRALIGQGPVLGRRRC